MRMCFKCQILVATISLFCLFLSISPRLVIAERVPVDIHSADKLPRCTGCFSLIPDREFKYGSWRGAIKSSNTNIALRNGCDSIGESWKTDHPGDLVDALIDTKQAIYAFEFRDRFIVDGVTNPNVQCRWDTFRTLASEAEDKKAGIHLWASYGKTGSGIDQYIDTMQDVRCAAEDHSSIRGLTIDDFNVLLRSPWNPYIDPDGTGTRDEFQKFDYRQIERLYRASKDPIAACSAAPQIKFTPAVLAREVATMFVPSYVLGVRGFEDEDRFKGRISSKRFSIYENDIIELSMNFNTGGMISSSDTFEVSFLLRDTISLEVPSDRHKLVLALYINEERIGEADLFHERRPFCENTNSPFIDLFRFNIDSRYLSDVTANQLAFRLEVLQTASGEYLATTSSHSDKIAVFWDVKVMKNGSEELPLSAEAPRVERPRFPDLTEFPEVIASTNEAWRLDKLVDGLWLRYTERDYDFDLETYRRVIKNASQHFQSLGKTVHSLFWGNQQWRDYHPKDGCDPLDIDLDTRFNMFEINKAYSNGIIVWRLENGLYKPNGGMFTERPGLHGYDYALYHPKETPGAPGWYQSRYSLLTPWRNSYTVRFNANGIGAVERPRVKVQFELLEIGGASSTSLWLKEQDLPAGTLTSGFRFSLPEAPPGTFHAIRASLVGIDSIGNGEATLNYNIRDLRDEKPLFDFFMSGVDEKTEQLYNCAVRYFKSQESC